MTNNTMEKIFYICPDFAPPSGGIKRLYTHVQILRDNGYDAYIVHFNKGFRLTWFDHSVPIIYFSDNPSFSSADTLVIPEVFPGLAKKLRDVPRKVVIALNPHSIFKFMDPGEDWKDYGVSWVMTNSPTIKKFIEWSMGIENVILIGTAIDRNMFYYSPGEKTRKVSYITRKDSISPIVENILLSRKDGQRPFEFFRIENLPIKDYAKVLRQSEIFLATSSFEGFPRSIIEAMACGCICIGFDGICGKDYIIPSGDGQNFIRVEPMNFIELAEKLEEVTKRIIKKDPLVEKIKKNAIITASRFTAEAEKESVLGFWKTYLEATR